MGNTYRNPHRPSPKRPHAYDDSALNPGFAAIINPACAAARASSTAPHVRTINTAVLNTNVLDRMEIMDNAWMPSTACQSRGSGRARLGERAEGLKPLKLTNEPECERCRHPPRMGTNADSMPHAPESNSRPRL